ncbi:MAG: hypothetical protein KAS72_03795 [Phycisphaerales bacterium]|nr:hypothetical protein [Phycisphaerales bacterium]
MTTRKTLGIAVGLILGWYAASFVQTAVSYAQDEQPSHPSAETATTHEPHDLQGAALEQPHEEGESTDHHADPADHSGGEHHGKSDAAAEALAVHADPPWFSTMRTGIIVLFILAALVGSAALLLKGPEPPDPADAHSDH